MDCLFSLQRNKVRREEEDQLLKMVFDNNASAVDRYNKLQADLEERERLRLEELSRKTKSKKRVRFAKSSYFSLSSKIMGSMSAIIQTVGNAMSSKHELSSSSSRSIESSKRGWFPFLSSKKVVVSEIEEHHPVDETTIVNEGNRNNEDVHAPHDHHDENPVTDNAIDMQPINEETQTIPNGENSADQGSALPKRLKIKFSDSVDNDANKAVNVPRTTTILPERSYLCKEENYTIEFIDKYSLKFLCF